MGRHRANMKLFTIIISCALFSQNLVTCKNARKKINELLSSEQIEDIEEASDIFYNDIVDKFESWFENYDYDVKLNLKTVYEDYSRLIMEAMNKELGVGKDNDKLSMD